MAHRKLDGVDDLYTAWATNWQQAPATAGGWRTGSLLLWTISKLLGQPTGSRVLLAIIWEFDPNRYPRISEYLQRSLRISVDLEVVRDLFRILKEIFWDIFGYLLDIL